jgi:hypothetical protein
MLRNLGCDLSLGGEYDWSRCILVGLVELVTGIQYQDILTPWTSQQRVLHHYFHDAADAYTLNIRRAWRIVDTVPVVSCRGSVDGDLLPFQLRFSICLPADNWSQLPLRIDSNNGNITLDAILHSVDHSGACCIIPMIAVVNPIAQLVMSGTWDSIMLLRRFGVFACDCIVAPPPLVAGQPDVEVEADRPDEQLGCGREVLGTLLGQTCETLRWSLTFAPRDGKHTEQHLKKIVGQLDSWSKSFDGGWFNNHATSQNFVLGRGGTRHSAQHMFSGALLALQTTQRSSTLKRILADGLEFVAPGMSRNLVTQETAVDNHMLSLAMTCTDLAHMLMQRQELSLEHSYALFWKYDSSPIGGHDWFVSSYTIIRDDALIPCYRSVLKLRQTRGNISQSDLCAHTRCIVDAVWQHVQTPMIIGSGKSSLEHKVAALLQALFLDTGSTQAMLHALHNSYSMTSDFGTEFGIGDFHVEDHDLRSLLPSWLQAVVNADRHDDDLEADANAIVDNSDSDLDRDGPEAISHQSDGSDLEPDNRHGPGPRLAPPPPPKPELGAHLFSQAFAVPGFLHIFSNCMKDAGSVMTYWPTFEKSLKAVSRLLSVQFRREKFISSCILNTQMHWMEKHFATNMHRFINWRWGSLHEVLVELLRVGGFLQRAWSKVKYTRGDAAHQKQEAERPAEDQLDMQVLDESIRSCTFWCYAQMLHAIHSVPIHMMSWCEGCPCHEDVLRSPSFSVRSRSFAKLLSSHLPRGTTSSVKYETVKSCPMGGRRLPEIVENRHIQVLSETLEKCASDLLREIQQWNPNQEALHITMADFEAGKANLHQTIELKCAFLQQFPYCLAKLASPNEEAAKKSARELILRFDKTPNPLLHHRVTLLLLSRDSGNLREQLEWWCSGSRPLGALPNLERLFAIMQLVPICERDIEAQHSLIKKRTIFKRARSVLCSMTLRVPHLRRRLASDPAKLPKLVHFIEQLRSSKIMMQEFSLVQHVHNLCGLKHNVRQVRRLCKDAIYRRSVKEQHSNKNKAKKFNIKRSEAIQRVQVKAHGREPKQPKYEAILAREWLSHLRTIIQLGDVLEFPADLGCLSLHSAQDRLDKPANGVAHSADDDDDLHPAYRIVAEGARQPTCLVKVVHKHPSNLRLVKPTAASGSWLAADDMCVSVHHHMGTRREGELSVAACCYASSQARRVMVGLQSSFEQHGASLPLARWTSASGTQYSFKDVPVIDALQDGVADLCTELVSNGAMSAETGMLFAPSSAPSEELIRVLLQHDLIASRETVYGNSLHLTPKGMSGLQFGRRYLEKSDCTQPRPNFAVLPVTEMTNFELMTFLRTSEWPWHPLPKKRPAQFCHVIGDAKRMYGGLDRLYLMTLAEVERRPAEFLGRGVKEVRHDGKAKYYRDLLHRVDATRH